MDKDNKIIEVDAVAIGGTTTATKVLEKEDDAPMLRDTADILAELDSSKEAEKLHMDAQKIADVVGEGHADKRPLQRITQNGMINFSGLSESEKSEIIAIGKSLNVRDKMSIKNFGSELCDNLNKSTKTLLAKSSQTKIGAELEDIMREVSARLGEIDLDDIKAPSALLKLLRKIPFIGKLLYDSAKKCLEKYVGLEQEVELMQQKLEAAQAIAMRDNNDLELRFQSILEYIQILEKLIVAAAYKSKELERAIAIMEAEEGKYTAIDIHDAKQYKHELDKHIASMQTWHLSYNQTLFRIRQIQDANIAHSNAIADTVDKMMPQLRDQLHEAVVLYNLEQGLKAHETLIDGFNKILIHNADAAHDMKIRVTNMTESTAIKLETLKHNQQKLIDTNREVMQIMKTKAKERERQMLEISKMEKELDNMLLGDSAKTIFKDNGESLLPEI